MMEIWNSIVVTIWLVTKHILSYLAHLSTNDVPVSAITCCSELPFFIDVAIFLPSYCKNSVPWASQSTPTLYLWAKSSPIIKECLNLVHMMKVCTKVWLPMSSIKGTIPTGPHVTPLAVFTHRDSSVMLTLSDIFIYIYFILYIFIYKWCEIHEHVASASNRAIISLLLRSLTAKLDIFNFT